MKEQQRKGDEVRGCGCKGGAPGEWKRGGCCARAKQGGGFVLLCRRTIVGTEKLLVMESINSVHDWGDVFISAGGVIILCNFACYSQKGVFRGLF